MSEVKNLLKDLISVLGGNDIFKAIDFSKNVKFLDVNSEYTKAEVEYYGEKYKVTIEKITDTEEES